MKNKSFVKGIIVSSVIVFIMGITSCATSVPVTLTRPAELDLGGAKTIAVLPFQLGENRDLEWNNNVLNNILNTISFLLDSTDPQERDCAIYLENALDSKLMYSEDLNLISSDKVKSAIENGTKNPADVYLTGKFYDFKSDISSERCSKTEDDVKVYYYTYKREVSVSITYQVVDSKSNKIIAYKTVELNETSSSYKDRNNVPEAKKILTSALDNLATKINRQLQPYQITKSLYLVKDKTKNPDLKKANELAKSGLVEQSQQLFYSVYKSTNEFSAGYNSAILLQAMGRLEEAKSQMVELTQKYSDKQAVSGLRDIQYEIDQAKKLEYQRSM